MYRFFIVMVVLTITGLALITFQDHSSYVDTPANNTTAFIADSTPPPTNETAQEVSSSTSTSFSTSSISLRVPIAVYHSIRNTSSQVASDIRQFNVPPTAFDEQLRYLQENGFHTVTFAMLHDAITQGTSLPSKPVILSFDDGWRSQYTEALPVLKKYGFTATFFLYPNVIERENYMTWEEVRALRDAGMEIGSHSKSHQYMTKQTSEEQQFEVEQSKAILKEKLGIEVATFAYPFGLFDAGMQTMLTHAGYTTARGLGTGTSHSKDTLYELSSYLIRNDLADFTYFVDHTP